MIFALKFDRRKCSTGQSLKEMLARILDFPSTTFPYAHLNLRHLVSFPSPGPCAFYLFCDESITLLDNLSAVRRELMKFGP